MARHSLLRGGSRRSTLRQQIALAAHPPTLDKSIRDAIHKGASMYNMGKQKECYEIYLATAYQGLSQQTIHSMQTQEHHKTEFTDVESQKILDLLTKATTDGIAEASKGDYSKAAWALRHAFDAILKIKKEGSLSSEGGTSKKPDDGDTQEDVSGGLLDGEVEKVKAEALYKLCNTMGEILDIKNRTYLLKTYKDCFVGNKAIDKLIEAKVCIDRAEVVTKINKLMEYGLVYHVTRDHTFKDEGLFYKLATSADLRIELNKFGHKTNDLHGEELTQYATILGRYMSFQKHPSIGVLRLDYDYPPAPGDIDHPESYNYPVYYRVVPGLTFEMCQSGVLTDAVAKAFDEAVLWLANHKDVSVITGDCGFMFWFVERVRKIASKKCISLSPLMQLPGMVAACGPEDKILVLTANGKSLDPMRDLIQRQCGVDSKDSQFIVVGCENVPHFGVEVAKGLMVDVEKAEPGIVDLTKEMIKAHPEVRMILFECTELPPYSDAVREATRLPVMDAITNCDFFMQGFLDNGNFGLNGWYEEWDGVQEEYVLGQNLDNGQKLQCMWCPKKDHIKHLDIQ